jgi:tetratricopeptide (TPR) repeat protein
LLQFVTTPLELVFPLLRLDNDSTLLELFSSVSVVVSHSFDDVPPRQHSTDPDSPPRNLPPTRDPIRLLATLQNLPLDDMYQSALNNPHGGAEKSAILNGLGQGFLARYNTHGNLRDLHKGVSAHYNAVQFCPDGHPEKAVHSNSYGRALFRRFEVDGKVSDLDDAISMYEKSIALNPDDHFSRYAYLNDLGISLHERFGYSGDFIDLDNAISAYQAALRSAPDTSPDKHGVLSNFQSC